MSNKTTKLVPIKEFEWTDDYSFHRTLTCKNHPTAKYFTKNPFFRSIHLIKIPEDMTEECKCPFEDLVVVVKETE